MAKIIVTMHNELFGKDFRVMLRSCEVLPPGEFSRGYGKIVIAAWRL